MFTVGLTGGIGSGKSAAGVCFRQLGIEVVDADIASRKVVEPGSEALRKIAEHFGANFIESNGSLNRRKLRTVIFEDAQQKLWLESLLHPLMQQWIHQAIHSATSPYAVLESPLLLETNQHKMVNQVIVIDVPEEVQVVRYLERDGGTAEQAKAIIASQMKRQQRIEKADFVIDNTGALNKLNQEITQLHRRLLKLSEDKK